MINNELHTELQLTEISPALPGRSMKSIESGPGRFSYFSGDSRSSWTFLDYQVEQIRKSMLIEAFSDVSQLLQSSLIETRRA